MKTALAITLFVLGASLGFAQSPPAPAPGAGTASNPATPPSAAPVLGAVELEKLAAPIALYPDPLIAVLLPASTYPVEIVQAARFVANTSNVPAIDDQPWDENVRALARFPSVIQKMSDDLSWTVDLGQAFVEQPLDLMDAIQSLRTKAQSLGALQTTTQQVVIVTNAIVERTYETQVVYVTNTIVQIVPANPQVIYVPTYNPVFVYAPPPGYVYNPAVPLITFSAGLVVGSIIANRHCNWYYGGVYYGRGGFVVWGSGRYPYYPPPPRYRPPPYRPPPGYRPPPPGHRPPGIPPPGNRPPATTLPTQWQPDQARLRRSGAAGSVATMEAKGWGSGTRPAPSTGNSLRPNSGTVGNRPSTGAVGDRPSTGAVGNRPATGAGAGVNRPATGGAPSMNQPQTRPSQPVDKSGSGTARPAQGGPARNPQRSPGDALGDMNSGGKARDYGNRGAASRRNNAGGSGNRRGAGR